MAHLEHDRVFGGPRCSEVLHVPAPLVVERGPARLVLAVPLDDVIAVEEVLVQPLASQSQEVACLLHLFYQNVPSPLGYHPHIHVPWERRETAGRGSELR